MTVEAAPDAVLNVLVQRDCLGGERVVELQLPRPVRSDDLARVDPGARCEVLSELPRPFFRVDVPGRFLLTGIVGDARVRFTVRLALRDRALDTALAAARALLAAPEGEVVRSAVVQS